MVNVDKRVKPAEKQAASATARRPRNQALNSSIQQGKKISTKGKNPFTKLNSSKLNCSIIDGKTYEEARKILTSGDENYEYLWDYFNEYMTKLGDEIGKKVDIGFDVVADEFFNTMADTADENQFYEKMKALGEEYGEDLDSSKNLNCSGKPLTLDFIKKLEAVMKNWPEEKASAYIDEAYDYEKREHDDYTEPNLLRQLLWDYLELTEEDIAGLPDNFTREDLDSLLNASTKSQGDVDGIDASAEGGTDLDSGCDSKKQGIDSKLNCSEETKIVTESGNEVSLSDIQIIQDPNTNEIALFIQEDPDEAIPEGFTVIGVASQPALPAADDGAVCPECGQDPCVCKGKSNDFDSSKKKIN